MRILHTSDWHLGRQLYGKSRHEEQEKFLFWLSGYLHDQQVETLLVAGDIFDTTTPGNRSSELYYQFLKRLVQTSCRHVVIIGGNHDSPTFLNAPKEILELVNVHLVSGIPAEEIEDELIILKNDSGAPEMIVAAVPYLRESKIRTPSVAESVEEKMRNLAAGIADHYREVAQRAILKREEAGKEILLLAMGHLFASGGQTATDDGVRELYVGTLAGVGAEIFSPEFDYVALGHLHLAQTVAGNEKIRYSGSPIPMGFGELKQPKQMLLVDFKGREATIQSVEVPSFQKMVKLKGDGEELFAALRHLVSAEESCWVEVNYNGEALIPDLKRKLDLLVEGSRVEILKLYNPVVMAQLFQQSGSTTLLEELSPNDLFERRLEVAQIPEEQRCIFRALFGEVLRSIQEADQQEGPF